jgi:hypothetical protein
VKVLSCPSITPSPPSPIKGEGEKIQIPSPLEGRAIAYGLLASLQDEFWLGLDPSRLGYRLAPQDEAKPKKSLLILRWPRSGPRRRGGFCNVPSRIQISICHSPALEGEGQGGGYREI